MNHRYLLPLALTVSTMLCAPAQAQTHRYFPAAALRGEFVVTQYPDVLINGRAAKLAPGAVVFGDTGLTMPAASLTGQKAIVHYVMEETTGLVMTVWVLNPVELANKVWPRSAKERASMVFDGATQTWRKP